MSKDDHSSTRRLSPWASARHQGSKAVAWTIGSLLKLGGILGIICGLLTFALAGMDPDPRETMFWGVAITCLGLLMLYIGNRFARQTKKP